jgi:hypothetical protein
MPRTTGSDGDESLKRLGGGRWETRDGRFAIEPQSGTWAVVDAEETNELGMPLVRGPFRSLTEAKAAIADARESAAPTSPLAGRLERPRAGSQRDAASAGADEEVEERAPGARRGRAAATPSKASRGDEKRGDESAPAAKKKPAERAARGDDEPEEPEEPGWFRDLEPSERGRARRLIERLTAAGARDAVSIVRRDLAGDVPAVAAEAIRRRLAELPPDAAPAQVVDLLAEGRDEALGVRWRIVDGDGRPIVIDAPERSRRGR